MDAIFSLTVFLLSEAVSVPVAGGCGEAWAFGLLFPSRVLKAGDDKCVSGIGAAGVSRRSFSVLTAILFCCACTSGEFFSDILFKVTFWVDLSSIFPGFVAGDCCIVSSAGCIRAAGLLTGALFWKTSIVLTMVITAAPPHHHWRPGSFLPGGSDTGILLSSRVSIFCHASSLSGTGSPCIFSAISFSYGNLSFIMLLIMFAAIFAAASSLR